MTTPGPQPMFAHMTVADFLEAVGARTPTPGGGAVASAVGAIASALARMVVQYSLGKKNLAEHQPALEEAHSALLRAGIVLLGLAEEDAEAYGRVNELSKLPAEDPRRLADLPQALDDAVRVPTAVVATAGEMLRLLDDLVTKTNRHLRSDLAIAAVLAEATARAGAWNVWINAQQFDEEKKAAVWRPCERMTAGCRMLAQRVEDACR